LVPFLKCFFDCDFESDYKKMVLSGEAFLLQVEEGLGLLPDSELPVGLPEKLKEYISGYIFPLNLEGYEKEERKKIENEVKRNRQLIAQVADLLACEINQNETRAAKFGGLLVTRGNPNFDGVDKVVFRSTAENYNSSSNYDEARETKEGEAVVQAQSERKLVVLYAHVLNGFGDFVHLREVFWFLKNTFPEVTRFFYIPTQNDKKIKKKP